MGTFNWPVTIASLDGERNREISATVDTGASYTVVPSSLLKELGIPVTEQAQFELADGRLVDMDMGEARAAINGRSVATLVVFGQDETPPLLGAYTLEGLRLAVDPVNRRLVPTRAIMY
jgi:clan AA aspartic protease